LVDVRPAGDFAGAPIEGALNIPLNASFSTWAGWLLAYDRPILLVADASTSQRVVRELAMIGLDQVAGRIDATDALRTRAATPIAQLPAAALASRDPRAHLIDVRNDAEWGAGHIAGAEHRPLGHLHESLATLPRDTAILVQCQGGARSAIAASLLRLHGYQDVVNVQGGWNAYVAAGLPVTR
jgi:hydroxyacylglutathione hydrolase